MAETAALTHPTGIATTSPVAPAGASWAGR